MTSYDQLNACLLDRCITDTKAHSQPERREETIWQTFDAGLPALVPHAGLFDGFHAVPASISKICLVRFDNDRYSVFAGAVGRPVDVRAYAERIELRHDGRPVASHPRGFGREQTIFDPWDDVPVLAPRRT